MSDTPRTDAQAFKRLYGDIKASSDVVQAGFARSLERELAVARDALEIVQVNVQYWGGMVFEDQVKAFSCIETTTIQVLARLDEMGKEGK